MAKMEKKEAIIFLIFFVKEWRKMTACFNTNSIEISKESFYIQKKLLNKGYIYEYSR